MTLEEGIRVLNALLRVGFFFLMVMGLLLASLFLYLGLISGAEWFGVCSVLFTADRMGNAIGSKM